MVVEGKIVIQGQRCSNFGGSGMSLARATVPGLRCTRTLATLRIRLLKQTTYPTDNHPARNDLPHIPRELN